MLPKKLPRIPPVLFNIACTVNGEGKLNMDGQVVPTFTWEGKCILVDKNKYSHDKEKFTIRSTRQLILPPDDILIAATSFAAGTVVLSDGEWTIVNGYKPMNPDGTVHHVELELI